jgi:hypothetical protein
MHVTAKLSAVIRSSRQRMQAGQSPSAVKSVQPTGETKQRKQQAGHTSTAQPNYIDSGRVTNSLLGKSTNRSNTAVRGHR